MKKLIIIAAVAGIAIFAFIKLTSTHEEHEFGS